MVDEMASLHKNEAWDLLELSAGKKPIGSKWVFKKKTNAKGNVEKYKARLVAKGYSQVLGIDFGDIFSPVVKVTSIRLLLSVAATFDFEVEQMDVKTSFLHGDLEEEIYMNKPEGFVVKGKKELDSKSVKVPIPVGVKLSVEQCPKTQEYEENISRIPYASAVSSLMYVMVYTRPDIAHAVRVSSRFMSKPGKEHWTTLKRVFSQSAIFLAKNPTYHSKTKNIDVQYHFVRDMIQDKKVLLVKVDTLNNTADALTKYVSFEKFS
eukprot:PITA_27758